MRGASRGDPECGARRGVSRLRLATAGSRGPGSRPPGITTWLRGARCTDPEEMPEMEARPPAQNRHGGAPSGARPDRKGRRAPRRVPGLPRHGGPTGCRCTRASVGAPPPLIGVANRQSEWGVASREEQRERRNEKERFFVGWAKAHAEQRTAAPQTRSRAPCPRGRAIERADGVGTALR
jgi:hypothetical protein